MIAAGRALAVLRGRRFLTPQDVFDVAPEILRHRLILTYDALAERRLDRRRRRARCSRPCRAARHAPPGRAAQDTA